MKFKTFFIIFLFFCAAFVGAGLGFVKVYEQKQEHNVIIIPNVSAFSQVNENIYTYLKTGTNGSLCLSGNIQFDNSILLNSYDGTWKNFNGDDILSYMNDYISSQGCFVGSVDGVFAGEGKSPGADEAFGYSGKSSYNAPDVFADMLGSSGVDMLAMANKHAYDGNFSGIAATKKTLSRANITPVGIFQNKDDIYDYEAFDIGEITFGIYSYTEDLKWKPSGNHDYAVHQIDLKDEKQVNELCELIDKNSHLGVDISCVYIYFKKNAAGRIDNKQKEAVDRLIAAGADIIVGANPDIVEPIEIRYNKKGGKEKYQFVMYSLGNFITGQTGKVGNITRNTGVVARFSYDEDNTGVYLDGVSFLPTYCVSYPTMHDEEDAGNHVKVFSIPEVYEYMEAGGVTKSLVSSTYPQPKRDRGGHDSTTEAPPAAATEEASSDAASTEEVYTETPATTETSTEEITTEEIVPDGITKKLMPFYIRTSAVGEKENEPYEDERYTSNLTKGDFSYIKGAYSTIINRLLGNTDFQYEYKDGWFFLKMK